jgi:hypothetical protein
VQAARKVTRAQRDAVNSLSHSHYWMRYSRKRTNTFAIESNKKNRKKKKEKRKKRQKKGENGNTEKRKSRKAEKQKSRNKEHTVGSRCQNQRKQ